MINAHQSIPNPGIIADTSEGFNQPLNIAISTTYETMEQSRAGSRTPSEIRGTGLTHGKKAARCRAALFRAWPERPRPSGLRRIVSASGTVAAFWPSLG